MDKLKLVPTEDLKEKSVAFLMFESHAKFIEQTTANWAKLAESMDIIDALDDGDEEAHKTAQTAKAGIAFTLLDDIELLQDIYLMMYQIGTEDVDENTTEKIEVNKETN